MNLSIFKNIFGMKKIAGETTNFGYVFVTRFYITLENFMNDWTKSFIVAVLNFLEDSINL